MNQLTVKKDNRIDFILYSSEELSLLRLAESEFIADNESQELTRYEQGEFDISELVAELGLMSFFSDKKIIVIRISDLAKFNDDDFELFCSSIELSESCRVAIFINYTDRYAAEGKRAKSLKNIFEKNGICKNIAKLTFEKLKKHSISTVKALGCTVENSVVDLVVNKYSHDILFLNNELEKLAAYCNYSEIRTSDVEQIGTTILSSDIFSLINMLTNKNFSECFKRLDILIDQGNEPIAILAAISNSFIDVYRVKIGGTSSRDYRAVFKDFGYKGSDYRLKKASELANKLPPRKLSLIIKLLIDSDLKLKSSSVDRSVLLYRYIFEILVILQGKNNGNYRS